MMSCLQLLTVVNKQYPGPINDTLSSNYKMFDGDYCAHMETGTTVSRIGNYRV